MTSASKQTQFWLDARCGQPDARRTQSIDAVAVDAECPQRGRGMPAEWTENARSVDAGRTQSGRRTHADAVPSYFLAVLYNRVLPVLDDFLFRHVKCRM